MVPIAGEEVEKHLLNAQKIGVKAYGEFCANRLSKLSVEKRSQQDSVFSPIKKLNLKTFS